MRFAINMARREVRAAWRKLVLFFFCIALGVGAMVSLRSFTKVLGASIADSSRMLLSADIRIDNREAFSAGHVDLLTRRASDPRVLGQTRMIEVQTIVRAAAKVDERPVMAELRAVDGSFPLRGAVRLTGGAPYSFDLLASGGTVVSRSLTERLHLGIGDTIKVGTATLTIRGIAERIPGSALNFSPMPRVLVEYGLPDAAGLTGFGSRATHFWLFNVPDGQERAFAQEIGADYRARRLSGGVGTFHFIQGWLTSSLSNIDGFLSLVGLSIVVLGGIGIASVTRVFVQQRIPTVAILKCLGGRNRRVLGAYATLVLALSLGGSLLGVLVAKGITTGLSGYVGARLPVDMELRLSPVAAAQGVAVGVLIGLLFALPPLLDIREVKPILVLRHDSGGRRRRIDWLKIGAQILIAASIAALAGWMAGTYRNASIFVGGIFAAVVVLHLAGTLLMRILSRLRRRKSFAVRQGIGSLYRPGNQTRVILFSVGLGALFLVSVRLFQVNMQQEYSLDLEGLSADMFLIDVLPAQRDGVESGLNALGASEVRLMPIARARMTAIKRAPSNPVRVPANRTLGEWRLTQRPTLDPTEQVVAGQFWSPAPSSGAEVSVQDGLAEWLGLALGDVLVFDVGGRPVECRVTSIRRFDRRARALSRLARADFVVRPGTLQGAPHTFVGAAKGPTDSSARARLQNEMLTRYPGMTLVDALDDIGEIRRRINEVSTAVSFLGGFVLVCGVLTLVGSVAMTKMQRVYEAALLKTLGAKRRLLMRVTLIEYGMLGLLAGIIGSGASIAVTWVMSRWGNQPLPWQFHPWINVTGAILTAIAVTIVGMLATLDVAARKPLSILREQ